MRAIVQEGYGSPDVLRLREIEKPVPGEGEVVVRVAAASVNAMDAHMLRRLFRVIGRLTGQPRMRAHGVDVAGVVEALGPGVTGLTVGDEVFGVAKGAYAEYALTHPDRIATKPRNLTFEQAAAIPVAGVTALQGLRDKAGVTAGRRVLVYGAGGGVGTFAVLVAKALGAHVTAVSTTVHLDLLRSIGADEVVDYTKEDFVRRGGRYDVLFDVGANRSLSECRRVLAPDGVIVLAGAPKAVAALVPRLLQALWRPRIVALMARIRRDDLLALKDLAEAGKLTPVIDRSFPLAEAAEALRLVASGHPRGKVVIRI